jgi:hypothetical protein
VPLCLVDAKATRFFAGDQAGARSKADPLVSSRLPVPLELTTWRWLPSPRSLVKTIEAAGADATFGLAAARAARAAVEIAASKTAVDRRRRTFTASIR